MNKKYTLSIFALGFSCFAYSQTFLYGIGIGSMIQTQTVSPHISSFTFTNSFRFSFNEKGNSSFSIDLPATIGFSSTYSGQGPDLTLGIMIDAPLLLSYNYGAGYKRESNSRFGFFAGAGFGYHRNEYSYTDDNNNNVRSQINGFGPVGNTGVRFAVGRNLQHNFEIRFSYMKMIDGYKTNIFGIGCFFNF
jgi:outer membrane protein W